MTEPWTTLAKKVRTLADELWDKGATYNSTRLHNIARDLELMAKEREE